MIPNGTSLGAHTLRVSLRNNDHTPLSPPVLRLMLAGARPDGILCLTYTKVAASEMANRIFAHLGRWAAADNATLAAALLVPAACYIGIMLFARYCRRHPML